MLKEDNDCNSLGSQSLKMDKILTFSILLIKSITFCSFKNPQIVEKLIQVLETN
jgi:hypothetical protein